VHVAARAGGGGGALGGSEGCPLPPQRLRPPHARKPGDFRVGSVGVGRHHGSPQEWRAAPVGPRLSSAVGDAVGEMKLVGVGMWEIALTQPPGTRVMRFETLGWVLLAATGTVARRSRPVAEMEAPGVRAWRPTRAQGRQQTVRDRCLGGSGEWRRSERVNSAPRSPRRYRRKERARGGVVRLGRIQVTPPLGNGQTAVPA